MRKNTTWIISILFLLLTPSGYAQRQPASIPNPNSTGAQPASRRPNVLLIITDDQGYGDLGLHGNEQVSTPALDRLGRESFRFDRFFVSPLCAPTRASLLTGRYSLRTGVSGVAEGQETMRAEEVTIAEALRVAGYRTGLFGKWHNGEHFPYTPNGQGFQEAFGFNLGHWNNYFDTWLEHNGQGVKTKGFITDVLTDAALKFISANQDQPFFCYLSYNAPHSPFQVPDKYFDKYQAKGLDDYLASVYGMVENVDDNVARVLARLDELKLRDNTIVIFLTDNGPNGARFNGGMRGVKGSLHEGGSRVPFFLRWPARFRQPRLIKQIAAHIDVFPTLLELCGAPAPKTLPQDGRSLVPLLEGGEGNWPDRTLFTQHRLNANTGAVRTERYRLVNEGRGWELFDMESDPAQKKNIAAEQPEVAKRLTTAYEDWWREVLPQTRQSRAPIPVGHAEENPVELPTPQSQFTGGLRYSGRHPNNAWLTNWTNIEAMVEWELDVAQAGKYEVSLQYLCPRAAAGARVQIGAAGSATEATLRETNGQQIKSPDRVPRTEVYEMDWATLRAGVLTLPRGRTKLTVRALTKPGEVVMDLKSVALKRIAKPARPQPQTAQGAGRPNLLFLFADDMRADTIAAHGNPHIKTPNLDKLVRGGFSFRGNYIFGGDSGAVCVPSRAMLMSGKTWFKVDAPTLNGARLMPELLGENGYATFATGKWHNGQASWLRAFQRGKAVMFGGMSDHTKVPVRDLGPDGKLTEVRTGEKFSSELFADAAIEFLQSHDARKPFFAYVAFTAPHDPRQPPPEYREMYYRDLPPLPANFLPQLPFDNGMMNGGRDENLGAWPRTEKMIRDQLAEYYGLITHMDEQIGRILAALEKTGQANNTIIIFAADNGLALGSHGLLGKQSVFEHSMRTPLVIAGPGIPHGKSTRAFTYLLDIFPTLCDTLGIQPPADLEGESLRPLWEGKKMRVRDSVFLPYIRIQRAVRDQRWKLIAYPKIGHLQLFDLQTDPHETANLIDRPQSARHVSRLMKLMKQWQTRAGDTLELPAQNKQPPKIDLTGQQRKPDQWQPDWVVKKYFGGSQ